MKLYFAALHSGWKEIWEKEIPQRILLSFYYLNDLKKTLEYCKERDICKHIELILDSGAFSAWSSGKSIDISSYAQMIKKIQEDYNFRSFYAVNLDVIPGTKGCKITQELSKKSMLKGWDNYLWLKTLNIDCIHVFHEGEDERFLMNTIIKKCKYIGISPSNDSSTIQKIRWCERIFHLLPEEIRTHGFAVTSSKLIKRFPWTSVDSASWSISAGLGRIQTSFGVLYYSNKGCEKSWCSNNPALKEASENKLLEELLSYGIEFRDKNNWQEELKNNHRLRRFINYCYFKKIGEQEMNRVDKPKKFIDKQISFL